MEIIERKFEEYLELQAIQKRNPHDDEKSRKQILDHSDWGDTTITPFERQKVGEIFNEVHDIFARHRFDTRRNRYLKVKLTQMTTDQHTTKVS